MDNLRTSEAIEGLIRSSRTVYAKVEALLKRTKSASSSHLAEAVLLEVSTIRGVLPRLRSYLEDDGLQSRDNVYVDQLSTTVTGCVKQFSELESMLGERSLDAYSQSSAFDLFTWAHNEKRIQAVTEDLRLYRVSLAILLQLLQHNPISDRSRSPEQLQYDLDLLKDRILSKDQDLSMRISSLSRPASIATSASVTSGSTASTGSTSSRISLASMYNASSYRLPITAKDLKNGHHYPEIATDRPDSGGPEQSRFSSIGKGNFDDEQSRSHGSMPVRMRSTAGPRTTSALSIRPRSESSSKTTKTCVAELEMTARKYQGYWRASFTANIPAAAAMCGCLLLVAGSSSGPPAGLIETPETAERAADLCDALETAPSPAKVIVTLHSHRLETMFFALKLSLIGGQIPAVPLKVASGMYQKVSEAKGDSKKTSKAWPQIAKAMKKIPQETIVPMMFLIAIGRKLGLEG